MFIPGILGWFLLPRYIEGKKKNLPLVSPLPKQEQEASRLGPLPLEVAIFLEGLFSIHKRSPLPSSQDKRTRGCGHTRLQPREGASTFKGLAQALAAQADLQDISIGQIEAARDKGRSGCPVQAVRAISGAGSAIRVGWWTRGSQTRTGPGGRWRAGSPTCPEKGCCLH